MSITKSTMHWMEKCESYMGPIGRILMGAFFFLAGVNKVTGIESTAGMISSVGLPAATLLAWVAALFLIVAGGAMIAGYQTRYAAQSLAAYTLLVTFLFHGPQVWADDASGMQQLAFMKNTALFGGLLFMAAYSACGVCQHENTSRQDEAPAT